MNLEKERLFVKQQIDIEVSKYSNAGCPISCKANCSNCCHVQVTAFPDEIDNIMSLGIDIDMDKLESQVNDWPNSDKTCVFIKDGNCSIHDNKPLHCMSHMVNTDPKYCKESSLKAPHMVRSKAITERLRDLRKQKETVILHKELYNRLR